MIPHEKEMVTRLADRPFALIGINSDGGQVALQEIIKEQGLTWRHAADGSTKGPIATRWNVSRWPTIYILDQKGVIRFRDLRGKELEDAVVQLLNEMEPTEQKTGL
jgi:hypothetical protein